MWAAAFVVVVVLRPSLARHPFASGIAFAVIVFLVMRLVVLPLSAFPFPVTLRPAAMALDLLSHSFLFGVPIALGARWAMHRPPSPA
jgi:hypothetical protein